MEELIKQWGIGIIDSIELLPSFAGQVRRVCTKDGHSFILKEKSDRAKAEWEADLLFELAQAGAPVAVPMLTASGGCVLAKADKIYCLTPQLRGKIVHEHYAGSAIARAELFGKAIAYLHGWLSAVKSLERFPDMQVMEQVREWAIPACQKAGTSVNGRRLERTWAEVEAELSPLYAELPIQLIHRDAHPGNMLFEAGHLTGFTDFEMVTRGPRIFDLCYCGTSLLVSGFPDEDKLRAWPGLFQALVRGYESIRPLCAAEKRALYGILIAIELIFVAFSLESGSEESARRNEGMVYWLEENRQRIQA